MYQVLMHAQKNLKYLKINNEEICAIPQTQ